MKLSYFRKSTYGLEETLENLKNALNEEGFTILGETVLPKNKGIVIHVSNEDWLSEILDETPEIYNLLPNMFVLLKDSKEVKLGIGDAGLLAGVTDNKKVQQLSRDFEAVLKNILHASAGVSDLKPTNVRLFSTKSCPYCTMEKDWLEKNNVKHEVIYVDSNQKEAQYMVEKTGQMGVPVTEFVYAGAESDFIIGFDTVSLSKSLGI